MAEKKIRVLIAKPGLDGHDRGAKIIARALRDAGAVIVKPAQATFWGGYAGYFQDPDGHLWEVAFKNNLPRSGPFTIFKVKLPN